ncbi:hypothetical protein AWB81_00844 [Caballeronia arationis]|nr:hypothetical protein AWB81_00844 [Caballeronia arationis]
MPAIIAQAMPFGMRLTIWSNNPDTPSTKMHKPATMYAPIASLTGIPGNTVTSKAVPGADHAVMIGCLSHQLKAIPETAAPIEIDQTHDATTSLPTCAVRAA